MLFLSIYNLIVTITFFNIFHTILCTNAENNAHIRGRSLRAVSLPVSIWQSAITQQLFNNYINSQPTINTVLIPIDPNSVPNTAGANSNSNTNQNNANSVVINNNYFVGPNAPSATPGSSSVTVVNVQPTPTLSKQNQIITTNIVNNIMSNILGKSAVSAPVNPTPGSFQFRNISVSITSDIKPAS